MDTRCSRRKRSAGGRLGGRHLGVEHDQGGGGLPLPAGAPHGGHHAAVRHLLLLPHPAAAPHLPEPHPRHRCCFLSSSILLFSQMMNSLFLLVYGGSDITTSGVFPCSSHLLFSRVWNSLWCIDSAIDIAVMLKWHDINRPGLLGPPFRAEVSPSPSGAAAELGCSGLIECRSAGCPGGPPSDAIIISRASSQPLLTAQQGALRD